MRKNERPPMPTAHDAGFADAFPDLPGDGQDKPNGLPVGNPLGSGDQSPTDGEPVVEGSRRGRPPGRNRHTHSVSLDDRAYDRIMRAVLAEGLEFSAFMERAGLRLVDLLEERRGSAYPPPAPRKSILDDL